MRNISNFTSNRVARFGSGGTILRARGVEPLTDDALQTAAPSVFADGKHTSRSDRYTYIPTIEVLNGLRKEGFEAFEVRQGGSRDNEKRGFTKHMLRLRQRGDREIGDSVRELILLNSHDGTSSYQLMSGLFRMVCSNGLIVADGDATMQRVAHKGDIINNVIEGAFSIIDDGAKVSAALEGMKSTQLSAEEQESFASAALALRFSEKDKAGNIKPAPIEPSRINYIRREADKGNDLWKTFNRVQENLVNGGSGYYARTASGARQYRHTRPVNSIDGNVTLNRALWILAEKMKELKTA